MSRRIQGKNTIPFPEAEIAARNAADGKIIFTDCFHKSGGFLIQNGRLTAVSLEGSEAGRVGGIYMGRIKDIVPNIHACFVETGEGEVCFLPLRDAEHPFLTNRKADGRILAGDELPVQIVRDAQKTKPASVTAHISISTGYFALSPGSARIGYSAKLDDDRRAFLARLFSEYGLCQKENELIQEIDKLLPQSELDALKRDGLCPEALSLPQTGCVVRTRAGEIKDAETFLKQFCSAMSDYIRLFCIASHRSLFSCIRRPFSPCEAAIQQLASDSEYQEIVTDREDIYQELKDSFKAHEPGKNIRMYQDPLLPLAKLYGLESKLQEALNERVWLKSGGYLVIQPTEALTVIDVNSGKYESRREEGDKGALKVNLEAAEEIALQLRLRNLSGIIVADFINMKEAESRQQLMNCLRAAVLSDRVRTTVVDMTPLGLVELTRKKVAKPLYEQWNHHKS